MEKIDVELIKDKNLISQYDYSLEDISPVIFKSVESLKEEKDNLKLIIEKFNKKGFSIFEFENKDELNQEDLLKLTNELNLGGPFVPDIYQKLKHTVGYSHKGFNTIENLRNGQHRAFQTNNGQHLHSDGTLEKIGSVKTSLLFCNKPSFFGGETIIFNSVGAFVSIISEDTNLAKPLLDENSLRRVFIGSDLEYIGPSFKIEKGEIYSRYSKDNTSDWDYGFSRVPLLKTAYNKLSELEIEGSPFYLSFKLTKGQGILMANDKISHGRKAFKDSNEMRRQMIRGLFKNLPS